MKVLGISASARKGGNTTLLVNTVLEQLAVEGIETELRELAGVTILPCKACWACGGRGNCVHSGDGFCELFEAMKSADGIVLGSPTYSANVSATMQALLERAAVVADMNAGILCHKAGVAVSAVRRAGALQAVDTMNHFFLNHEMIVPGSTYWNMGYGQLPGDVEADEEGLANAVNLGQNMAFVLKAIHSS
jgi:multimeric flavodoxin WrbA